MTMQIVGWAIVHSLWQDGVIALVMACLFSLMRDTRPSARYAVGLAALAMMIAMPVATALNIPLGKNVRLNESVLSSPQPTSYPNEAAAIPIAIEAEPTASRAPSLSPASFTNSSTAPVTEAGRKLVGYIEASLPWLAIAWMLGLLVAAAQLIGGFVRTRRITRHGTSAPVDQLVSRVLELSARLGMSKGIRVLQSVSIDVPLVVGALRPVIVVPASLLTGLTPLQLDMLLAHELAHIRRYDFLVNLAQTVIETLLFYHPAVRWLSDRVRDERENCCDDIAVSLCGDARGYTATLLALEESRAQGFGLAAAANGGSLLRRAHRLITGRSAHVELGPRWIAGVVAIVAVLFTGRDAMGSIQASFTPGPAVRTAVTRDSTDKPDREPDKSRGAPLSVTNAPATGSLEERWAWAQSHSRGLGSSWVGYLVAGDPSSKEHYYADNIPVQIDRSTTISGHMHFGSGDLSGFIFYGVPLASVVGAHARGSTAIFFLVSSGVVGTRIERVHVGTFEIPMYFDRRAVIWLDSATDTESVALIEKLIPKARSEDMRRDIVAALGVHQTASLVVPKLIGILESRSEAEGPRREAAEWLSKKNDARAVGALSRAARTDRSKGVREESIEAFEHMPFASATDSLITFASTFSDYDYRRTAIESLGHRDDARALDYLTRVVRSGGDSHLRVDALEAIGDMPDGRGYAAVVAFARNDPDADIRRKAVESIAQTDPSSRALDVLMEVVRSDPDESVRREAVETIAEVHDGKSVAILRDLANGSESVGIQIEAVESLGETGNPEKALPVLRDIARNHPKLEVRKKALETLGEMHEEAGAVQTLVEVARNERDSYLREAAIEALGETHRSEGTTALASLARLGEPLEVRLKALEVYADQAEPLQALSLLKLLIETDKVMDVRLHALEALAELNDNAGLTTLQELARSSRDAAVKNRARELLDDR